jgi:hypothetical protein
VPCLGGLYGFGWFRILAMWRADKKDSDPRAGGKPRIKMLGRGAPWTATLLVLKNHAVRAEQVELDHRRSA